MTRLRRSKAGSMLSRFSRLATSVMCSALIKVICRAEPGVALQRRSPSSPKLGMALACVTCCMGSFRAGRSPIHSSLPVGKS